MRNLGIAEKRSLADDVNLGYFCCVGVIFTVFRKPYVDTEHWNESGQCAGKMAQWLKRSKIQKKEVPRKKK